MFSNKDSAKIHNFIREIQEIKWFSKVGEKLENCIMEKSIFSAYDVWNTKMLQTWEPNIDILEREFWDEDIDYIFNIVSEKIHDDLWNGYEEFVFRENLEDEVGLEKEIMDCIKRDIAWACIESIIEKDGLFTRLLEVYKKGHWPCSWEGKYPDGTIVAM